MIGLQERKTEWEGRPMGRTIGDAVDVESTSREGEGDRKRGRENADVGELPTTTGQDMPDTFPLGTTSTQPVSG